MKRVRERPFLLFILPFLFVRGHRWICRWLANNQDTDHGAIPLRQTVVDHLNTLKSQGKSIVLVTRTPGPLIPDMVHQIGCFDDVIAPEDFQAYRGTEKLEKTRAYAQNRPFAFIAHHRRDLPIMKAAEHVTLVYPTTQLREKGKRFQAVHLLGPTVHPFIMVLKALRPHHWTKNLLLAVPWVMAHQWHDLRSSLKLLMALLAFSLVASAVYICNDLLDLPADRLHPFKKKRPLASGALPISWAVLTAFFLFGLGILAGWTMSPSPFVWLLISYAVVVLFYSAFFKHCLVLDVVVLASLYALRIFAGGAVVNVPVSAWLLAFSGFFFLSLAFAKRYLELSLLRDDHRHQRLANRPYTVADLDLFRIAGPTCGLLSVLVLALYINSDVVQKLYQSPNTLWFLCPLFLYWILRTWVLVIRGETDSDPLVFALRDKNSLFVGACVIVTLLLAV